MRTVVGKGRITFDGGRVVGLEVWPETNSEVSEHFVWVDPDYLNADLAKIIRHLPCCDSCDGTGVSGDSAVPGGKCWDCKGTGHAHGWD